MHLLNSMGRDFLPRKVVLLGGARTPIGSFLGALRASPAARLAAAAVTGAVQRAGIAPAEVKQCVVGQVIVSGQEKGALRTALRRAGRCFPLSSFTLTCVSSLALSKLVPTRDPLCCVLIPHLYIRVRCYGQQHL